MAHRHREFASATGTYRGLRVSVVSTGIGTDNVEIVLAESIAVTLRPTFIRVGSCGALQPEMDLGDLVISSGAIASDRPRATSSTTGSRRSPITRRSSRSSRPRSGLGHRYHVGLTATAPGFFGRKGGRCRSLPIRYPDLAEDMARQRVMNFEMEASALLVLATLARCRAGVVCAVAANRTTGQFIGGDAKDAAEAADQAGLESLLVLAQMDEQQRAASTDRWRPSLWTSTVT